MCLAVAAVTGGNNYGRQSGGQVVTAYAPDTAIDYLLLRHEPRFSHYGALFRTLATASSELLRHPIATPTALTPPARACAASDDGKRWEMLAARAGR